MTEPIKPATDQDILSVAGQHPGMGPRLIARANADRATIAELLAALEELMDRLEDHPAYAELTEDEEIETGGDTAEFSYLARVARAAILRAKGGKPEEGV